jgi:hypothetical protein
MLKANPWIQPTIEEKELNKGMSTRRRETLRIIFKATN